jgi:hypothetical protein
MSGEVVGIFLAPGKVASFVGNVLAVGLFKACQ